MNVCMRIHVYTVLSITVVQYAIIEEKVLQTYGKKQAIFILVIDKANIVRSSGVSDYHACINKYLELIRKYTYINCITEILTLELYCCCRRSFLCGLQLSCCTNL